MIFRGRPLFPEILDQTDRINAKSPIFYLFSLVAKINFIKSADIIRSYYYIYGL